MTGPEIRSSIAFHKDLSRFNFVIGTLKSVWKLLGTFHNIREEKILNLYCKNFRFA